MASAGRSVRWIGIAIPVLSVTRGRAVLFAANLGWRRFAVSARLAAALALAPR